MIDTSVVMIVLVMTTTVAVGTAIGYALAWLIAKVYEYRRSKKRACSQQPATAAPDRQSSAAEMEEGHALLAANAISASSDNGSTTASSSTLSVQKYADGGPEPTTAEKMQSYGTIYPPTPSPFSALTGVIGPEAGGESIRHPKRCRTAPLPAKGPVTSGALQSTDAISSRPPRSDATGTAS